MSIRVLKWSSIRKRESKLALTKVKRLDRALMKGEISLQSSSRRANMTHAIVSAMQKRQNCVPSSS